MLEPTIYSTQDEHVNQYIPDAVVQKYVHIFNLCELTGQWWNKGNAKCGISPHLKIRPCDLDNQ
jgi:hypothetical protein